MANTILTPQKSSTVYRLDHADRQAIIANSPSNKIAQKIEQQRQAFIEKYGNDGVDVCA